MKCVAIVEAQRPGLDSVILWEDNDRLVGFAYLDGKVTMTRPLAANDLTQAINEVRTSFQINEAQLTRIYDWRNLNAERIGLPNKRW